MQKHAPKPIAKVLDQDGNSQNLSSSFDQAAYGNMNDNPQIEPKNPKGGGDPPPKADNRVYKQGKMRAVWRPRDSQVPRMNSQFSQSVSSAPCQHGQYNGRFSTGQETVYTARDQGLDALKQMSISRALQNNLHYQCQQVLPLKVVGSLMEKINVLNVKAQSRKGRIADGRSGDDVKADMHTEMKEMSLRRAKALKLEEEERTRQQKAKALTNLEELDRRILAHSSNQGNLDMAVTVDQAKKQDSQYHANGCSDLG